MIPIYEADRLEDLPLFDRFPQAEEDVDAAVAAVLADVRGASVYAKNGSFPRIARRKEPFLPLGLCCKQPGNLLRSFPVPEPAANHHQPAVLQVVATGDQHEQLVIHIYIHGRFPQ